MIDLNSPTPRRHRRGALAIGPVFHIVGLLVSVIGVSMLIPAVVDYLSGQPEWTAFVGASALTLTVSGGMVLATLAPDGRLPRLDVRQVFALVPLALAVPAAFAALPFRFGHPHLTFGDALFESMSGLTTTGATILTGIDQMPAGILLWRALLHWYGGFGVILLAIVVLPLLGVGGMSLFRSEAADLDDKPFGSLTETIGMVCFTYFILTIFTMVAFIIAGMTVFDALCHAMSALSAGAFSTHDAALGYYANSLPVQWIAIIAMIAGVLPLTFHIHMLRAQPRTALHDSQVITMFGVLAGFSALLTVWVIARTGSAPTEAVTAATLRVVALATTCGLSAEIPASWGTTPFVILFVLYFMGGCTGSPSGAIKLYRWQILWRAIRIQMAQMVEPHRVVRPRYHGKAVGAEVIQSVANYIGIFIFTVALVALALSALHVDPITALSAAAATLGNTGPGLGPIIGPGGSYAPLPAAAKGVLTAAMLIGRLEIIAFLVLFMPSFWRR